MRINITIEKLNELNEKLSIINNFNVGVNTQNGFKKIKAIGITSPNSDKVKIQTNDFKLSGSPLHRVKFKKNWIFLKDIKVGDYINTINGLQKIKFIETDLHKEDLWDIEVDGEEYYSNGILSHNSSLLESFEYTLYGRVRSMKAKKWCKLSTLPNRINGELLNKIKFKSSGTEIEIHRGISPNILRFFENGIEDDKAGKSNIDDKIERFIGMDIETFKSFISLSINDFKNFISLSTEEKQLLLDKLFNLEIINILNDILKEINKSNKLKLTKYESEIASFGESIDSIKRSIEKAIEKEKQNIQLEINQIKSEMESKKEDYLKLKEKVDKIKAKEEELKLEIEKEKKQHIILQTEIKAAQKDIDLYNSGKCPTCATDFDSEHFHGLKDSLLEKMKSLEGLKIEIENNIKNIKEKQLKLQKISDDSNEAYNDITYLLRNFKVKLEKLQKDKEHENGNSSENVQEFLNTIKELEDKKLASSTLVSESRDKELYYKELSKIFSEDGVKKSIISGIIKPINHFIDENIRQMQLPFGVQLDETFTASITQMGNIIEQDSLSTGEQKLINISILCAYLKLIKTKKMCNILFLDEVFSSIDINNIQKILGLLKSFANEYNINIFVVHHAILNQEMFDRIITVEKNIFTSIEEIDMQA